MMSNISENHNRGNAAELATAIEVARKAGELVRVAFHRPATGRGGVHIDAVIEEMIRKKLAAAFPPYGIIGEELRHLDRRPADPEKHAWAIDPIDGSASFERGLRGASICIALLRRGVPVLGVIFSPLYPNDHGDLLAWAEGQRLTRNGRVVKRSLLTRKLTSDHTVLATSACADGASPARWRSLPSISYRLALVAVGEAEATISVNAPVSWDYAAGHALLRAVGGGLFDGQGKPVTYTDDGHGSCGGTCIGASPQVARDIAKKLGQRPFGNLAPDRARMVGSLKGRTIADARLLSRAQGCLMGQIAADALGSACEFLSASQIARSYPDGVRELKNGGTWNTLAGQPSDDSELCLTLARSLIEHGKFNENAIAGAYGAWYESHPFDIGTTTSQAFSAAARTKSKPAAAAKKAASKTSQANGALMRISPLAIFGWNMPTEKLAELARRDAQLSHPHRVCQDANALYIVAIQHALKTGDDGTKVYGFARDWAKNHGICDDVFQWLVDAENELPGDFQTHMGWVRIAFQNAFSQLLHAKSFEEGVVNTVGFGGDTDTNGCIAGALLGAAHGLDAVPFQWRDRVLTCRPMDGAPGVRRPRPREYWPVDTLELAERLLVASDGRRPSRNRSGTITSTTRDDVDDRLR